MDNQIVAEYLFQDININAGVPVFFLYDRTSSLEEGDDPKKALLYPCMQEDTEENSHKVTNQVNLITSLILFSNKLEFELGKSLPTCYALEQVKFYLLNVGKYTFALRRPHSYPTISARTELDMIYFIFITFYGEFNTSGVHTTNCRLEDNPDISKAANFDHILSFFSKMKRPQLAVCTGSWCTQTCPAELDEAERKLTINLSLLVESVCSSSMIVGLLATLNKKVIFTKHLKPKFVQAVTLLLSGDMTSLGKSIVFENSYNVVALSCHLTSSHVYSYSNEQTEPRVFHALIHIRGDLSLTLLVTCTKDPLLGDWFQSTWRRYCTSLRNELFSLHHHLENTKETTPMSPREHLPASIESVRLHKQSNVLYMSSARAFSSTTSEARLDRKRLGSNSTLGPSHNFSDWYTRSVGVAQQAFCDMPSISEIRLASSSEYRLRATQSPINNKFIGSSCNDPRAWSAAVQDGSI